MPIKKLDGTPFTLRGPNPLMNQQTVKEEWCITHNLDYTEPETLIYDTPTKIELPKVTVEEEIPQPVIPEESKAPPPPPPPVKQEEEKVATEDKSLYYCLPAIIKEVHDRTYDEVRRKLTYGEKFRFEAVPVQSGDMKSTLWTTVVIETGSIIYSIENRRWWKVLRTVMQDNGGFLIECMPSSDKPSFD